MPSFPTLSSGSMKVSSALADDAIAMYPTTLANSFSTRVVKFMNDSEQRWTMRNVLFACTLNFHDLTGYDYGLISDFFQAMRGAYTDPALLNTFSIQLSGIEYNYCVFDQDFLEATVNRNERISVSMKLKQVRPN